MLNFNVDVNGLEDLIRKVVAEEVAKITINKENNNLKFIRGINGLAEYLGISRSKAQKLKNENAIPFVQDGRMILFDSRKVDEALIRDCRKKNKTL